MIATTHVSFVFDALAREARDRAAELAVFFEVAELPGPEAAYAADVLRRAVLSLADLQERIGNAGPSEVDGKTIMLFPEDATP